MGRNLPQDKYKIQSLFTSAAVQKKNVMTRRYNSRTPIHKCALVTRLKYGAEPKLSQKKGRIQHTKSD